MTYGQAGSEGHGPRPRTTKRDTILSAAHDLFLAHGFEATSVDQIAERANVSRQTIYNNFDNKESLFRALTGALADQLLAPLLDESLASGDVLRTLTILGERALWLSYEPSNVALYRLIVCEAPKFPDLAREIYDAGARRATSQLAQFFQRQTRAGVLNVPDPDLAAEQFFGMLHGHRHFRALLGIEDAQRPSARDIAGQAAAVFVRAYGVPDQAAGPESRPESDGFSKA